MFNWSKARNTIDYTSIITSIIVHYRLTDFPNEMFVFSADELIKRYRALRDRFVRYKRVEMLTGSENKYRSPIVDKMEFLTPHVFVKR